MDLEDFSLRDSSVSGLAQRALPIPRNRTKVNKLEDLDLEQELLDNYNDAQSILDNVDASTPTNQLAQTMNTITGILDKIIKLRTELYNAERMKKLETSLIYALKQFPELQEVFMEEYSRVLKK
jgi:hypothetical protein